MESRSVLFRCALIRPSGTFSRRRGKGWVESALGLSGFFSRRREKGFISVEVELLGELVVAEFLQGLPAGLGAVGGFGLLFDAGVDGAALFGDLGEVADAGAGDEDGGAGLDRKSTRLNSSH